ncbi:MAG: sulfotransferase [Rhodospirillaceae bacterium]|nr:sulfotransferase [Rhodospirillaceae bacterium]
MNTIEQDLKTARQHHAAGQFAQADSLYQKILQTTPDHAETLHLLGILYHQVGKIDNAMEFMRKALASKPDFAEAHSDLGNMLLALGRLEEAVASYQNATLIKPEFAEAHSNLGIAQMNLGMLDDAALSYGKAIAVKPDYANAHYNLCEVLEKTNRTDDLRTALENAKKHCPQDYRLALREAQLLKRDNNFADARTLLDSMRTGTDDAGFMIARAYLLGELCDRLDDVESAYGYFSEGNLRVSQSPPVQQIDKATPFARIDVLAGRFSADWIASWSNIECNDSRPDPVFLVGFPRSGTTLLDTILRSHQGISLVEEMPTIQNVEQALEHLPGTNPNGLAGLDQSGLMHLRQVYFAELDKHLEPEKAANIVIDRMPWNNTAAGHIKRIFPDARFIFAQRHPCDCVLSCFMQNFLPSDANVNFLNLEDAAHLYDRTMNLWQQYQDVLELDVCTVRYEDLVDSFEKTLTPVLDFLGVDWDEGIRDYTETAKRRGTISTASYNQVTQPIYKRASGRWQRYQQHLQTVLPVLLPWAKRFGYDD